LIASKGKIIMEKQNESASSSSTSSSPLSFSHFIHSPLIVLSSYYLFAKIHALKFSSAHWLSFAALNYSVTFIVLVSFAFFSCCPITLIVFK